MRISADRMAHFRYWYREGFQLGERSGNPFAHPVHFSPFTARDRKVFHYGFKRGIVKFCDEQVARIRLIQVELDTRPRRV